MKNKYVAAILAILGGFFGLHRYYLGQVGRGILSTLFFWALIPAIIAFIDFIIFLAQSQESFDAKYNKKFIQQQKNNTKERTSREKKSTIPTRYREINSANTMFGDSKNQKSLKEINDLKAKAIKHFRAFEIKASQNIFEEILHYLPYDASVYFNLACIYSLSEEKMKAFEYLDKAVHYGMEDYNRIDTNDALAYLRVQEEFGIFKKNNYKIPDGGFNQVKEENIEINTQEKDIIKNDENKRDISEFL